LCWNCAQAQQLITRYSALDSFWQRASVQARVQT
jgi:hypothetical protein